MVREDAKMVVDVERDSQVARTEAEYIMVVADELVAAAAEGAALAATITIESRALRNSIKTVPIEHIPVTSKTSSGRTHFININPDINVQ